MQLHEMQEQQCMTMMSKMVWLLNDQLNHINFPALGAHELHLSYWSNRQLSQLCMFPNLAVSTPQRVTSDTLKAAEIVTTFFDEQAFK